MVMVVEVRGRAAGRRRPVVEVGRRPAERRRRVPWRGHGNKECDSTVVHEYGLTRAAPIRKGLMQGGPSARGLAHVDSQFDVALSSKSSL